jgi:TolB-like protein/Flp pilus assembly protein TadD
VISQHTQERLEGYFRLEWKLAVERSHLMATERLFLVPVVVDATRTKDAIVPDEFRAVQWTSLPAGNTPPSFVERVQGLLSPVTSTTTRMPASAVSGVLPATRQPIGVSRWSKPALFAIGAVLAVALAYAIAERSWSSKHSRETAPALSAASTTAASVTTALFSPPPHSIAVLPFVNLSGEQSQQYFSDGLTEELLDALTRINELQVAARTSSFFFEGEHPDIATVAHKLNVASVLEGSVRRSGNTIRVTAQLDDAVTGFHLWSQTYDRDTGDILKLQSDIANAVAGALKVKLLGDVSARIELGGTHNPAAFDAYLRGSKAFGAGNHDAKALQTAIAAYAEATRLDPNFALAFAGRSRAHGGYAGEFATGAAEIHDSFEKAQADARRAIVLAPELGEGYLALGYSLEAGSFDLTHATEAYERAVALAPGTAEVLRQSGRFAVYMGRFDAGVTALRRAVVLDPINPRSHELLGEGLFFARRYGEAVAALAEAVTLIPDDASVHAFRGLAFYALGNLQSARASCETKPDYWVSELCLAVVSDKLGRHADAEAVLAKMRVANADSASVQYAEIYAQWGNIPKALEWLDTAVRVHDPGLAFLKTDPLLDPLRTEPRFHAIERELKFPD